MRHKKNQAKYLSVYNAMVFGFLSVNFYAIGVFNLSFAH